jgi:PIN domain nuclease of toxin-antitoxin system
VRLLLDTHIALWSVSDDSKLSGKVRDLIAEEANSIAVSVASLWEIAIKRATKPAAMPVTAREALNYFKNSGYQLLPVAESHAVAVEALPNHHGDPFDRIIIAQAKSESLRLITRDRQVARYGDFIELV